MRTGQGQSTVFYRYCPGSYQNHVSVSGPCLPAPVTLDTALERLILGYRIDKYQRKMGCQCDPEEDLQYCVSGYLGWGKVWVSRVPN